MFLSRRHFIRTAAGLLVPASALATVPIPLSFWKAPSTASSGPSDSPSNYTGLKAWYRSSDLVLNDGDPVSTWVDQSGNSNNATGSGAARPTYKTNIIGSTPVVRYAGAQTLTMGTAIGAGAAGHTAMFLTKPLSSASIGAFIGQPAGGIQWLRADKTIAYYDTVQTVASSAISGAFTDFKLIVVRHVHLGTVNWRENKTDKGTSLSTITNSTYTLIGNSDFSLAFSGDFVELASWQAVLTDGQCDSLYDNYFKSLYTTLP